MNDLIYLDLECLLPKIDLCSNSINKSYTEDIAYHEACGYSSTILRNHSKEITTSYYRGKDCLSKLCKELREIAMGLFSTEKLPMTPLTHKQRKKHSESDKCHICNRKFIYDKKISTTNIYRKLWIMIITQANTEVQHIPSVT